MKVDLDVLWIDNNTDFIDSLRKPIGEWCLKHGFELQLRAYEDHEQALKDLEGSDVDLIVIDYNLNLTTGDQIIVRIRQSHDYHDIVFYSQDRKYREAFDAPPDGVFFVDRADTKDRILDILKLRMRKASDLGTLRGWFVADSIELEFALNFLMSSFFANHRDRFEARILGHEGLMDFGKKYLILSGIVNDYIQGLDERTFAKELAELRGYKDVFNGFMEEIIHVRNALAHQISEVTKDGKTIVKLMTKKGTPIELTDESCAVLRGNIIKHRNNLRSMAELLKTLP